MKKIFLAVMAVGMSLTSCMNEEFPNEAKYGYINVNVANDPVIATRATNVSDLSTWTILAGETNLNSVGYKIKAGTYTVTAKNYTNAEAALSANENWGEAYYEGSVANVVVTAGQTATANIDCGKAKNGRVKATFALLESSFKDFSVVVGEQSRQLTFDSTTSGKLAYFNPGEVPYTFTYKYNSEEAKTITGTINVVAATEHQINISSNDNGIISVTVTYDETFEDGEDQTIEIDAATGEKVSQQ